MSHPDDLDILLAHNSHLLPVGLSFEDDCGSLDDILSATQPHSMVPVDVESLAEHETDWTAARKTMAEQWVETNYNTVIRLPSEQSSRSGNASNHQKTYSTEPVADERVITIRWESRENDNKKRLSYKTVGKEEPVLSHQTLGKGKSVLSYHRVEKEEPVCPAQSPPIEEDYSLMHLSSPIGMVGEFSGGMIQNSCDVLIEPKKSPEFRHSSVPCTSTQNNCVNVMQLHGHDTRRLSASDASSPPVASTPEVGDQLTDASVHNDDEMAAYPRSASCPADRRLCFACQQVVYAVEALHVMSRVYHKRCFRCQKCRRVLSVGNFRVEHGTPFCEPHHNEFFKSLGPRGKSTVIDNDFMRVHVAVQSGLQAELHSERPPHAVTQNLVSKFQQLNACLRVEYTPKPVPDPTCIRRAQSNAGRYAPTSCQTVLTHTFRPVNDHETSPSTQDTCKTEVVPLNSAQISSMAYTPQPLESGEMPNAGRIMELVAKFTALQS